MLEYALFYYINLSFLNLWNILIYLMHPEVFNKKLKYYVFSKQDHKRQKTKRLKFL